MTPRDTVATRHCGVCELDVAEFGWVDDEPGGHIVLVESPMTFSQQPTDDANMVHIAVEQTVGMPLCRTLRSVTKGSEEST